MLGSNGVSWVGPALISFFFFLCFVQESNASMLEPLLDPQSRFGDKPVKFQVVCPQNGTAVLEGLTLSVCSPIWSTNHSFFAIVCTQNGRDCSPKRVNSHFFFHYWVVENKWCPVVALTSS